MGSFIFEEVRIRIETASTSYDYRAEYFFFGFGHCINRISADSTIILRIDTNRGSILSIDE